MTYLILQFDDAGQRPLGVLSKRNRMLKGQRPIDHHQIALFTDEEDAWRIVERHHVHGEVWGVISSQMLARKLLTGSYGS